MDPAPAPGIHTLLPGGRMEVFAVVAQPRHDVGQPPAIPEEALQLIVHEFCHPFVNPWVDAHSEALRPAAEKLFAASAATMKSEAYTSWQAMMYESLVRAATVRYFTDHGKPGLVAWSLEDDRRKGFWWTRELSALFDPSGPTLGGSAERVRQFFEAWARDPHAAVSVIEVKFDRPMTGAMSFYGDFPDVAGKPAWNGDKTVLRIPVALKPGAKHVIRLNSDRDDGGFRSAGGERLTPRTWTFAVK